MSFRDAIRAAMSAPAMDEDERREHSEERAERAAVGLPVRGTPEFQKAYADSYAEGRAEGRERVRAIVGGIIRSPRAAGNATLITRAIGLASDMPDASSEDLITAALSGKAPSKAGAAAAVGSGLRVDIVGNARARMIAQRGPAALSANMNALVESDRGEPDRRSPGLLAMAVEKYGPKDGAKGKPGSSRLLAMARQRYGSHDPEA